MLRIKWFVLLIGFLFSFSSYSADLSDIHIANSGQQATITLHFRGQPLYGFFPLHDPDRVVLDLRQSGSLKGLPLNFSGNNLVKRVRSSKPKDSQSFRLVFELTAASKTRAQTFKKNEGYDVVFTLTREQRLKTTPSPVTENKRPPSSPAEPRHRADDRKQVIARRTPTPVKTLRPAAAVKTKVVVAIDAGHGGQDPGAIGLNGLKEKNVTIAIARRLQALLNADPMFRGVLTRNGDYFISVMGRSDVARKQNANMLVSIHADAAPDRRASGASVWVLSNRRANSEMADWLEQHEKQSELLGGAGDLLASRRADPYLSQAVLDLQFGHSQRVGYDAAQKVLDQLQHVGALHKRRPEHASLGVLRSPDIPSLLVETGFISNPTEERLLGSSDWQQKIASSIYSGIRHYFLAHPLQPQPESENRPLQSAAVKRVTTPGT